LRVCRSISRWTSAPRCFGRCKSRGQHRLQGHCYPPR
jgi:hypothetical protein